MLFVHPSLRGCVHGSRDATTLTLRTRTTHRGPGGTQSRRHYTGVIVKNKLPRSPEGSRRAGEPSFIFTSFITNKKRALLFLKHITCPPRNRPLCGSIPCADGPVFKIPQEPLPNTKCDDRCILYEARFPPLPYYAMDIRYFLYNIQYKLFHIIP